MAAPAVTVAIIGTGNIGTHLMFTLLRHPGNIELALFAGIDSASDGLERACALGVPVSDRGIKAILADSNTKIVVDAASARHDRTSWC